MVTRSKNPRITKAQSGPRKLSGGGVKIACPTCERSHKSEEAVLKCAKRAEASQLRATKKEEDKKRRESQARKEPLSDYIRRRYAREGAGLSKVTAELKALYPPPSPGKAWTFLDVIEVDNRRLNWPDPQGGVYTWPEGTISIGELIARVDKGIKEGQADELL
jgi:hypothetical protein